MEKQYLMCEKPKSEYLNELIYLISNIKEEKKNKNFPNKVAKALICYKMADLEMDKIEFRLLEKDCGYIGSQNFNIVSINEKMMKFSVKRLVTLIDCLLHEFSHQKMEFKNKLITKDEFGNASDHYVPKFYEEFVYLMLHWTCDIELEEASDISVALYSFNENEQQANAEAVAEFLEILDKCKNETNKKIIDKMILLEKNSFNKFNRTHQTRRNRRLIEEFNYYYKNLLLKFQFEFAKKPINTPLNISKIYVARMLCPSDEADQKLFEHFLKLDNVDACIKIMNAPDFKNTPKNLKDLIALMQKNNVELSNLTGIDKNAIKRILNMNDNNNGQKSGGQVKNIRHETDIESGLEQ